MSLTNSIITISLVLRILLVHTVVGQVNKFVVQILHRRGISGKQEENCSKNPYHAEYFYQGSHRNSKLEDLKVLRRSPDLFNNVKIGQGQIQLIIKHILFNHIWGLQPFW